MSEWFPEINGLHPYNTYWITNGLQMDYKWITNGLKRISKDMSLGIYLGKCIKIQEVDGQCVFLKGRKAGQLIKIPAYQQKVSNRDHQTKK